MSARYSAFVDRTIRNGTVRIYGRTFAPDGLHMAYDGRCDGLRYSFGLYERGGELEPFVNMHSLAGSVSDPNESAVMNGPHCVDGTYPWLFWKATDDAARDGER